jgi:hypothetical protein
MKVFAEIVIKAETWESKTEMRCHIGVKDYEFHEEGVVVITLDDDTQVEGKMMEMSSNLKHQSYGRQGGSLPDLRTGPIYPPYR